jgi:hypothetical protein
LPSAASADVIWAERDRKLDAARDARRDRRAELALREAA